MSILYFEYVSAEQEVLVGFIIHLYAKQELNVGAVGQNLESLPGLYSPFVWRERKKQSQGFGHFPNLFVKCYFLSKMGEQRTSLF